MRPARIRIGDNEQKLGGWKSKLGLLFEHVHLVVQVRESEWTVGAGEDVAAKDFVVEYVGEGEQRVLGLGVVFRWVLRLPWREMRKMLMATSAYRYTLRGGLEKEQRGIGRHLCELKWSCGKRAKGLRSRRKVPGFVRRNFTYLDEQARPLVRRDGTCV